MKKKIILILSMCALLVCLFAVSAFATDYNFVGTRDFEKLSEDFAFARVYYQDENANENWFSVIRIRSNNGDDSYYVQPAQFKEFIVNAGGNESMTYSEICSLFSSISNNFSLEDNFNFCDSFIEDSSTYSALVDKIYNKPISQEDLTAEYNKGLEEGKLLGYEEGKLDGEAAAKAESEDDEESSFGIGAVISSILILCPIGLVIALIIAKRRKTRKR